MPWTAARRAAVYHTAERLRCALGTAFRQREQKLSDRLEPMLWFDPQASQDGEVQRRRHVPMTGRLSGLFSRSGHSCRAKIEKVIRLRTFDNYVSGFEVSPNNALIVDISEHDKNLPVQARLQRPKPDGTARLEAHRVRPRLPTSSPETACLPWTKYLPAMECPTAYEEFGPAIARSSSISRRRGTCHFLLGGSTSTTALSSLSASPEGRLEKACALHDPHQFAWHDARVVRLVARPTD